MPIPVQPFSFNAPQPEAVKTENAKVSTKKNTVVWNEKTICSDGIKFLKQRCQQLKTYHKLFKEATYGCYLFSVATQPQSGKKMVAFAKENLPELKQFYNDARKLKDLAIKKDSSSVESQQLINVVHSANNAITYFETAAYNRNIPVICIGGSLLVTKLNLFLTENYLKDEFLIINGLDLRVLFVSFITCTSLTAFIASAILAPKIVSHEMDIEDSEKKFFKALPSIKV